MARAHDNRSRACDQTRSLASLRLDDELSELEQALLDAHLSACAACLAFATDVAATTAELRNAPLEPLERGVSLPHTRRDGYLRALQTAAAGAVAAAAVVAGVISVTPAGLRDAEHRSASRLAEPVSPRTELQLLRRAEGDVDHGPAGTDTPV